MKSLLQLNLKSDGEKVETANLPKRENEEPRPLIPSKRLNRMINRAAHKAASEYGRSGGGIFSK